MKIVIFLNNDSLGCIFNQENLQAVIFSLENEKVTGVENEKLINIDINYITLWCLSKKIKEIYTKEITHDEREIFHKLDINIKTLDELENDYLYNTFILRD